MNLESCVVRVESEDGHIIGGTGFVIGPALAMTCAHVVEAAQAEPGEMVRLTFHAGSTVEAEVLADGWHPASAEGDSDDLKRPETRWRSCWRRPPFKRPNRLATCSQG